MRCLYAFLSLAVLSLTVGEAGHALAQAEASTKQPGMLGVEMRDITAEDTTKPGLDKPGGVWVDKVLKGSSAERAGIEPGDIILTVNGAEVGSAAAFRETVGAKGAGAEVTFRLLRQGQIATISATLATRPAETAQPNYIDALRKQFYALYSQGRFAEAEAVADRQLKLVEAARGASDPATAVALTSLGTVYLAQGRHAEALRACTRALATLEKSLGPEHRQVADTLDILGSVHGSQGRYEDAIAAYRRSLVISEKTLGPDHPDLATTLNNVGNIYRMQGRALEAIGAYQRALAIREKALGAEHPDVGLTLNSLGNVYLAQRRYAEAVGAYSRAFAILEKALGPQHPDVAMPLNNLGIVFQNAGRHKEAIAAYSRALGILEKALGSEHPQVAGALVNLATVHTSQGGYVEAIAAYKRALAIREKTLGPEHPDFAATLNNVALLHVAQHDWVRAEVYWQHATAILERRTALGTATVGQPLASSGKSETTRFRMYFEGQIKAAYRRAAARRDAKPLAARSMFLKAQWALASEAAVALSLMAARGASRDPKLATPVRERQDLVAEWQIRDAARTAAISLPPDKRNANSEASNLTRLGAIEARIDEIDSQLKAWFPGYSALVSPAPASVEDVQKGLRPNESLIQILDTGAGFPPLPEETFIWVVTQTESRWVRSDLGTKALQERVATLRCGLDPTNWIDASGWGAKNEAAKQRKAAQIARRDRCKSLTGADVTERDPPPFDATKAHALYQALFGQVEDLLKNTDGSAKHLLIIPSGPLTQLPFHVLVTEKPDSDNVGDYAKIAWLAGRHAITVLPSVASLKALRQNHHPTEAGHFSFVGFGNPLVAGADGSDRRAWAKQSCPKDVPKPEAVAVAEITVPESITSLLRGGVTEVAALRRQVPLPDTADELCAVARVMGAGGTEVNLGGKATETRVKQLNADASLAAAHVVHFATHGFIASETERIAKSEAEPALLLTPPEAASETDDGLLKASEVTELKLNADWVVLSACNTAAGGEKGDAEALSGLARAFFYAGARALLVSHWYVDSQAAVKVTTGAFTELQRDPTIGRAEALRRSMLAAMSDRSRPKTWTPAAHPAVWAPFVVVGEGGAER